MSSSHPPPTGLGADELRAAVRAVLHDVLQSELTQGAASRDAAVLEHVTVRTDVDLDALVRRVATLCEDPSRRAALRDGRHGFRLADGPAVRQASHAPSDVVRVDRGAVTERTVAQAAAVGARLVVGQKAVLTPLARDKARVLGVEIERER
ncbi:MAG: hypothetical protein ACXWDL_09600 [Nocardioides sp.]